MSSIEAALPSRDEAGARPSFFARIDPRWYSSSLLSTILVVGQWKHQILGDSYLPWMLSLGTALLVEIVLFRWMKGGWPNLLSAYISGNSVAILVKPDGALLWPFVVCSAISIASKYVLNDKGRHLWNPTNFGVCVLLLVASPRLAMLSHEWGNDLAFVALLWAIGLMTVYRAKVMHITLTYCASFVVLAWIRTLVNGAAFVTEIAPVTGPMYTLYMFFMITDPKTIVKGRAKQIGVVVAVAIVECAIRLACDFHWLGSSNPLRFAPPMFALFIVGPIALWWHLHHAQAAASEPARVQRT